tara:strand:+ start:294 stop:791 length:498 start_codon:yes stop_codon:yes gene_type:complete
MKKILSIILLFLTINVFCQESDVIWHTNADKAAEIAHKENKPLYLYFTGSDWCGWCIQLKKHIFNKQEFKSWANENIVLLYLDFPKRTKLDQSLENQNKLFSQNWRVNSFPTGIFVSVTKLENKKFQLKEIARHAVQLVPNSPRREFVSAEKWTKTVDSKLSNKN